MCAGLGRAHGHSRSWANEGVMPPAPARKLLILDALPPSSILSLAPLSPHPTSLSCLSSSLVLHSLLPTPRFHARPRPPQTLSTYSARLSNQSQSPSILPSRHSIHRSGRRRPTPTVQRRQRPHRLSNGRQTRSHPSSSLALDSDKLAIEPL